MCKFQIITAHLGTLIIRQYSVKDNSIFTITEGAENRNVRAEDKGLYQCISLPCDQYHSRNLLNMEISGPHTRNYKLIKLELAKDSVHLKASWVIQKQMVYSGHFKKHWSYMYVYDF